MGKLTTLPHLQCVSYCRVFSRGRWGVSSTSRKFIRTYQVHVSLRALFSILPVMQLPYLVILNIRSYICTFRVICVLRSSIVRIRITIIRIWQKQRLGQIHRVHIISYQDMHRLYEIIYGIGAGYGLTRATSYSMPILPPYTLQPQNYLRRGRRVRVHTIYQ